ncbi:protein YmgC [Escherichia coli]|uniref:protein YmgC n=1 Tax=Escherichia coli TaxID=562 RepID=UPI000CDA206C|nr:protein YmgC [Escherichia coli]
MNNSIPERFILQCALFKNLEREVFMTHGNVDSHIIDQALRLRLKDETSVILSDLYLQILQYIEMHKTTLTDIIINDRESVLS